MATGDTQQTICTTALFNLGCPPLSSFTSPVTPVEKRIVGEYSNIVRSELRRKAWIFAIKRTAFTDAAAPLGAPLFNTWTLPDDCIRVLRNRLEGTRHTDPDWWIEGNSVCRHAAQAPLLRYLSSSIDPSLYDSLFVEALAYKLAMKAAELVTQSSQKKEELAQLYSGAISEAGKQNAWEQPQGTQHNRDEDFSWLTSRRDGDLFM